MIELKLIEVDGEVGIIFPEALCQRLQVSLGDELHVEPAPNGMLIYANASET
jgi:antitoxin component of MazEF toxin-antitoxin module